MATISVTDDALHVELSPFERFACLHGDVDVPRGSVTGIRIADEPFGELRGMRFPGVGWPRGIAVGRWRHGGGRDLVVLRRGERAVVIDLDDRAPYRRLVIGAAHPEDVVMTLQSSPTPGSSEPTPM